MRNLARKWIQSLLAVVLIFTILTPQKTYAVLGVGDIVSDPLQETTSILSSIWEIAQVALKNAVIVGAVNVSQQIAHDAADSLATWIADGAPGGNPLQYMSSPGDYLKDAGRQAFGDWLGEFSEKIGVGSALCRPPSAQLGLPAGLHQLINGAGYTGAGLPGGITGTNFQNSQFRIQPKCNYSEILANYDQLATSLSPGKFLTQFNSAFGHGQNELDTIITSQLQALTAVAGKAEDAKLERQTNGGYKDLVSPISGRVVQPSVLIAQDASLNTAKAQSERENQVMSGLLASGAEAIPGIFASTFFNSLSNKLIKRLMQGKGSANIAANNMNLSNIFGAGRSAGAGPNAVNTSLKTTVIAESNWDPLTSYTTCPDKNPTPENCVIDNSFASAIRLGQTGKALTVGEALAQGKLQGNWELVSPSQTARNEDRLCYKSSYCYSNLAKLRKARVIPIGWEIAAATAVGAGQVTLEKVVNNFNNCGVDASGQPARDDDHPYCHLIDPNWVLKMPEAQCRAQVYGSTPESAQTSSRKEECVDQASCLQEDASGKCVGAYGYCMKERNTWRFEADACPAQFAGCQTFNNKTFGINNFLESTIDAANCNEQNTGCLGLLTEYKPDGTFDVAAEKTYLNDKAASCDAKYAGCSEVQSADTGETKYLRVPPKGLECKGEPTDPPQCDQYAHACTVDEVGCELYQPVDVAADPAVPGIATFATRDASGNVTQWNDECAAECVGYASYYPSPTQFDPLANTSTAFIAKTAAVCTAEAVGCEQFSNIDTAQKGGGSTSYFSSAQRCLRPEDIQLDGTAVSHAVFFSWEGSDQNGYQLHQHDLVTDTQGTPVYDSSEDLSKLCDENVYKNRIVSGKLDPLFDTDCRELINSKGAAYYKLLSKTLTSSAQCTAFRKEGSNGAACKASRGTFDTTSGACTYLILPSGSQQCTAEALGCRAYNGTTATNPQAIMDDQFSNAEGWTDASLSNEGIVVGDSVLKVSGTNTTHALSLVAGKTYSITFWAKGAGGVNVALADAEKGKTVVLNTTPLKLNPEWAQYQIGSAILDFGSRDSKILFTPIGANATLFLDNLTVKEQGDVVYRIQNSWNTPISCDPEPADNIPGPALNCHQYKPQSDAKLPSVTLTGFTSLCREQAAGCSKYQNTFNTADINETTVPNTTKKISADEFVYLVASTANYCPADKMGCSALGVEKNTFEGGKKTSTIDTMYRINKPSDYGTTICKQSEEWCQTFTGQGGDKRYFKYPTDDKQCVYRDKVVVNGTQYTGWFKLGTDTPCYPDVLTGNNSYGVLRNGDSKYAGNVAICEQQYNGCTEFIDHADRNREYPNGREYYFMKNSRLDTTSCNGRVSLKEGCVLLDDTTDLGGPKYASDTTYCKSDPTTQASCSNYLSRSSVPTGDIQTGGAPVSPITAKQFVAAKDAGGINCVKAHENGVEFAGACDEQLLKLKEVAVGNVIALGANLNQDLSSLSCPKDAAAIKLLATVSVGELCSKFADANLVVKVRRDRTCSEWLSCQSAISVFDPTTQKYKEVCTDFGVCNQLSTDSSAVGTCANWVTSANTSVPEWHDRSMPLTTNKYVARNVGWFGQEYSGYSLWNKFQPNTLGWFAPDANKMVSSTKSDNLMLGAGFDSLACNPSSTAVSKSTDGNGCAADVFAAEQAQWLSVNKIAASKAGSGQNSAPGSSTRLFSRDGGNDDHAPDTSRIYYKIGVDNADPLLKAPGAKAYITYVVSIWAPFTISEITKSPITYWFTDETNSSRTNVTIQEIVNPAKPVQISALQVGKKYVQMDGTQGETVLVVPHTDVGGNKMLPRIQSDSGESKPDPKYKYYKIGEPINPALKVGGTAFITVGQGSTDLIGTLWIAAIITAVNPGSVYDLKKPGNFIAGKVSPANMALPVPVLVSDLVVGQRYVEVEVANEHGMAGVIQEIKVAGVGEGLSETEIGQIQGNSFLGVCYARKCWYPLDGFKKAQPQQVDYTSQSCRGYPEQDAPYPRSVLVNDTGVNDAVQKSAAFKGANVCEKTLSVVFRYKETGKLDGTTKMPAYGDIEKYLLIEGLSAVIDKTTTICDCSYKRVSYGASNETKYYGPKDVAPQGICDGGYFVINKKTEPANIIAKKGLPCVSDEQCLDERVIKTKIKINKVLTDQYDYSGDDGHCQFQKEVTQTVGWTGYCLERDLKTHINNSANEYACMTWLPVEAAGQDVYNQYVSARYSQGSPQGNTEGALYCLQSSVGSSQSPNEMEEFTASAGYLTWNHATTIAVDCNVGSYTSNVACNKRERYACDYVSKSGSAYLNSAKCERAWLDTPGAHFYEVYPKKASESIGEIVTPAQLEGVRAEEIDHVDITFNSKNLFFPVGYKMRIVDDGVVRFFSNKEFQNTYHEAASVSWPILPSGSRSKCLYPRYLSGDKKSVPEGYESGIFDILPNDASGGMHLFDALDPKHKDGVMDNAMTLTKLSFEARCNKSATGDLAGIDINCNYFSEEKKNISDYFKCIPGGITTDFKENTEGTGSYAYKGVKLTDIDGWGAEAVTGVVRSSYSYVNQPVNSDEYGVKDNFENPYAYPEYQKGQMNLVGNAVDIVNGRYNEIWYARLDNHKYSNNAIVHTDGKWENSGGSGGYGDSVIRYGVSSNIDAKSKKGNIMEGFARFFFLPPEKDKNQADKTDIRPRFFEIRLNFAKDNKLESISAVGVTADGNQESMNFDLQFQVYRRNACQVIASVTEIESSSFSENKAYTNRVWKNMPGGYSKFGDANVLTVGSGEVLSKDAAVPYGALASANKLPDLTEGYFFVGNPEGVIFTPNTILYYSPKSGKSPIPGGAPNVGGRSLGVVGSTVDVDENNFVSARNLLLSNLFAKVYWVYEVGTDNPAVTNRNHLWSAGITGGLAPEAAQQNTLTPYKKYKVFGEAKNEVMKLFDTSTSNEALSKGPTIYALDSSQCVGDKASACRLARRNGMTINGQYKDGAAIYAKSSVAATMQFYGWADQDHMPLRRIKIDWGDKSSLTVKEGLYRNHKPVCSISDVPAPVCVKKDANGVVAVYGDPNTTCSTDSDCVDAVDANGKQLFNAVCQNKSDKGLRWSFGSWGGNSGFDLGACEEGFFQFSHAYQFSEDCNGINGAKGPTKVTDAAFIQKYHLQGSVGLGERVCIFTPKVQVMDNWGICNGVKATNDSTPYSSIDCSDSNSLAYTPYQGVVIVKE